MLPRPRLRAALVVGAACAVAAPLAAGLPAQASSTDGRYDSGSSVTVVGRTQGLQATLTQVDVSGLDPASAALRVSDAVDSVVRTRTVTLERHPRGAKASAVSFLAGFLVPAIEAPSLPAAGDGPAQVSVVVPLDTDHLSSLVRSVSAKPLLKPVDAVARVGGKAGLVISRGRDGVAVDSRRAPGAIVHALATGNGNLAMRAVDPSVRTDSLNTVIVVSRTANTLRVFRKGRLDKTFRVATGAPGFPTPTGTLHVVAKQPAPSWYNPGSAWASSLPRVIGPGPNNPLGTRAMALSAPGILIHGIPAVENRSIGSNASHGCIRMLRSDVERLFPTIPVGTTVIVTR